MPGFNALNFTDMYQQAFNAGHETGRRRGVENALSMYGADPQGAEKELVKYGEFDQANALRTNRMQDESIARRKGYAATAQGGGAADYDHAMHDALANGDTDLAQVYSGFSDAQRQRASATIGVAAQFGDALKRQFPVDPANPQAGIQARKAALDAQADQLSDATGIPKERILMADLSDGGIDTMHAQAQALGALPKPLTVGNAVLDPTTYRPLYEGDHWMAIPEGGSLVNTASRGQGGAGAPSAAPDNPAGPATANNNPGNLKYDGVSKWQGMTGVDHRGFVIFDSAANGMRAAGINMANAQRLHGINTLADYITRYAPASDHNDPAAYIQSVAQQTGLDPHAPLNFADPAVQAKVLPAMFKVESGGTPARVPAPPVHAAGGGVTDEGGVIHGAPKTPEWVDLTPEERAARHLAPDQLAQKNIKTGRVEVGSGANAQGKADRQMEVKQRQDFEAEPDVKNYNIVTNQYQNIKRFARDNSGSNDIGLIFSYMKMLDPNSVVREGEYATAQQTGGIPTSIVNQYNKAVNGQFLTPQQRSQYVSTAKTVHENARQRYDELVSQHRGYLSDLGLNVNAIQARANPDAVTTPAEASGNMGTGVPGANDIQHRKYHEVFKAGSPYGTNSNPYLVRGDKDFNNLQSGEYYIGPDGVVRVK